MGELWCCLPLMTNLNELLNQFRLCSLEMIYVYMNRAEGASPHSLLENFRSKAGAAVLLGTRALLEGVDIPGEALSVLVIAKLPFNVPSDPMIAARSETSTILFTNTSYQKLS